MTGSSGSTRLYAAARKAGADLDPSTSHDTRGNVSRCAGPIEVNPDKVAAAHREEGQQVSPAEVAAIDHIAGALGTKEQ